MKTKLFNRLTWIAILTIIILMITLSSCGTIRSGSRVYKKTPHGLEFKKFKGQPKYRGAYVQDYYVL